MTSTRADGSKHETYEEAKSSHYAYLNQRFDHRSEELRSVGYKYAHVPAMGIAVFTKAKHGKVHTIAAGTVLNADVMVWEDTLEAAIRF